MQIDETYNLESNTPVLLLDRRMGLFLVWPPKDGPTKGQCGIQVPGEEYHRWIMVENLVMVNGVLIEVSNVPNPTKEN